MSSPLAMALRDCVPAIAWPCLASTGLSAPTCPTTPAPAQKSWAQARAFRTTRGKPLPCDFGSRCRDGLHGLHARPRRPLDRIFIPRGVGTTGIGTIQKIAVHALSDGGVPRREAACPPALWRACLPPSWTPAPGRRHTRYTLRLSQGCRPTWETAARQPKPGFSSRVVPGAPGWRPIWTRGRCSHCITPLKRTPHTRSISRLAANCERAEVTGS
jgi:hypothetical protein